MPSVGQYARKRAKQVAAASVRTVRRRVLRRVNRRRTKKRTSVAIPKRRTKFVPKERRTRLAGAFATDTRRTPIRVRVAYTRTPFTRLADLRRAQTTAVATRTSRPKPSHKDRHSHYMANRISLLRTRRIMRRVRFCGNFGIIMPIFGAFSVKALTFRGRGRIMLTVIFGGIL